MFNRKRSSRTDEQRRGAATTELAVCLPMLVALVFGSIQACDLIYLKHAATSAAYEGTLELVKPGATRASVVTRVQQVLDLRGVTNYTVSVRPAGAELTDIDAGTPMSIAVSARVADNLMLSGFFATASQVQTEVHCPR